MENEARWIAEIFLTALFTLGPGYLGWCWYTGRNLKNASNTEDVSGDEDDWDFRF